MSPPVTGSELREAEAAERLGVSVKQLRRYRAEGAPAVRRGTAWRYPWPELRRWRDARVRAEKRQAPKGSRLLEAKGRKAWALTLGRCLDLDALRASQVEPRLMVEQIEANRRAMLATLTRWETDHLRPAIRSLAARGAGVTYAEASAALRRLVIALLTALSGAGTSEGASSATAQEAAGTTRRAARQRALQAECRRTPDESWTATIDRARAMRLEAEAELEERRRLGEAGHFCTVNEYADAFGRMVDTIRGGIFAWEGRSVAQLAGRIDDAAQLARALAQQLRQVIETAPFTLPPPQDRGRRRRRAA